MILNISRTFQTAFKAAAANENLLVYVSSCSHDGVLVAWCRRSTVLCLTISNNSCPLATANHTPVPALWIVPLQTPH